MSNITNTSESISTVFKVTAGVLIISTLLDLISELVSSAGLVWTWMVFYYLGFIVFAYLLYKTGETYHKARSSLNGAMVVLIISLILDLLLFLGMWFGWYLMFYTFMGVIMIFAASILRGIAFTLAHVGFTKVGKKIGNPIYIIFGWIDLVFLTIYWVTYAPVDDIVLMVGTYVDIALLAIIAIVLFVKSNDIKQITAQPRHSPAVPQYGQTYQQYSTYQPPQTQQTQTQPTQAYVPQAAQPAKAFCSHCGGTISGDDKFCENCGAKVE
ncbi:MAG: zinc ribbon domain-containing protein [Candidatus Heimdallarchaeota archaeon]|nr:zinc ribbon domain-containing protein [Candidatus Heimdallarchaeota archaeon]